MGEFDRLKAQKDATIARQEAVTEQRILTFLSERNLAVVPMKMLNQLAMSNGPTWEQVDDLLDRLSFRLHAMCKERAGGTLVWAEVHAVIEETDGELAKLRESIK